jgi:dTDP-4-amino-4,6-dideoxygalactose transaminase
MQPLQAIVGCHGLDKLDEVIDKRNVNARILDYGLARLNDFVNVPKRIENNLETFALYMGLFEKRDELKQYLIDNDVEVKNHYPVPLHLQKAARENCRFDKDKLKNVEYQANRLLTIPVHQFLNENHMHWVLEKIFKFYGKKYEY